MAVDPQHRYSNETERTDQDIYDDFKLKKTTLVSMLYTEIIERFKGLSITTYGTPMFIIHAFCACFLALRNQ